MNNYYTRRWQPLEGTAGANHDPDSALPWTGDYEDGLGNKITMLSYTNPGEGDNGKADGFGIARFVKSTGDIAFEFWPRLSKPGSPADQVPGWPIRLNVADNDGRQATGLLRVDVPDDFGERPVIAVTDKSSGELLYVRRTSVGPQHLPVFSEGPFAVEIGRDRPTVEISNE